MRKTQQNSGQYSNGNSNRKHTQHLQAIKVSINAKMEDGDVESHVQRFDQFK